MLSLTLVFIGLAQQMFFQILRATLIALRKFTAIATLTLNLTFIFIFLLCLPSWPSTQTHPRNSSFSDMHRQVYFDGSDIYILLTRIPIPKK